MWLRKNTLKENHNVVITNSLYTVKLVFIYDSREYPNGVSFESLSDLSNYTIGVLDKSATEQSFEDNKELILVKNSTNEGLAKQLHTNRINLWATVDVSGFMILQDLYPTEYHYYKSSKPFITSEINVIIPKTIDDEKHYSILINKGLDMVQKNGVQEDIIKKYVHKANLPDL